MIGEKGFVDTLGRKKGRKDGRKEGRRRRTDRKEYAWHVGSISARLKIHKRPALAMVGGSKVRGSGKKGSTASWELPHPGQPSTFGHCDGARCRGSERSQWS